MKRFLFFFLFITLPGFVLRAQFSKATLQANGLTCALCSRSVHKALQKLPFVESVTVDLKSTTFHIVFITGKWIIPDAIKEAVENAGFSVGALTLFGQFSETVSGENGHLKLGNLNIHILNDSEKILHGEVKMRIVDKGFTSEKELKKNLKLYRNKCFESGKTDSFCCKVKGMNAGERLYHVMI
ncbi:MAG: heavy-metal-associated domain-containing protein [Chitinophagaceae bacterium]|nr:heavy-metal-associated domain-containing protein [Chitinophagaceae bacterium]